MTKVKDSRNCVAFKLNYNNGGANDEQIGYCGVCSKSVIDYNINKAKRNWCSRSDCKRYLDDEITYDELKSYWSPETDSDFTCYESRTLRDWIAGAGADSNGEPRRISNADDLLGHLCLLTTVRPGFKEIDRIIFAMFIIDDYYVDDSDWNDEVLADKKYRLKFNSNEIDKLKFWSIHTNPNNPSVKKWGSGLFRYFDNDEALQFLKMAVEIKKGTPEENFAKEFLNHYCKINNIKI